MRRLERVEMSVVKQECTKLVTGHMPLQPAVRILTPGTM